MHGTRQQLKRKQPPMRAEDGTHRLNLFLVAASELQGGLHSSRVSTQRRRNATTQKGIPAGARGTRRRIVGAKHRAVAT
jgi:hypothetical protein